MEDLGKIIELVMFYIERVMISEMRLLSWIRWNGGSDEGEGKCKFADYHHNVDIRMRDTVGKGCVVYLRCLWCRW